MHQAPFSPLRVSKTAPGIRPGLPVALATSAAQVARRFADALVCRLVREGVAAARGRLLCVRAPTRRAGAAVA